MRNKNILLALSISLTATILLGCGNKTEDSNMSEFNNESEKVTITSAETFVTTSDVTVVTTTIPVTTTEIVTTTQPDADNSIAWLNYIEMMTLEILNSENNRVFLDEVQAALLDNSNPENIDKTTQDFIRKFNTFLNNYRMTGLQEERLRYIYEQNKGMTIKKAIRDSLMNDSKLDNSSNDINIISPQIALIIAKAAINTVSNYTVYKSELDQKYINEKWSLNDDEINNIRAFKEEIFDYTVNISNDYELKKEQTLSQKAVEEFVDCKQRDNLERELQFLETKENAKQYESFGYYWLELVECYYQKEKYQNCLDALEKYQSLNNKIFRKDYYLLKALPMAIVAASKTQTEDEYVKTANKYLEILIENSDINDWENRYFAAEIYYDLYSRTNDINYLDETQEILMNNINQLIDTQTQLNKTYISKVKSVDTEGLAKDEKKKVEAYNDLLKEKRKTELPEIYEPLALNCDFFFSIVDKLNLTSEEKTNFDSIVSDAFITQPVQDLYTFEKNKITRDVDFKKDEIYIPVTLLTNYSKIKVTVINGEDSTVYEDWKIDEVTRPSSDFKDFDAVYKSKKIDDIKWNKDSKVKLEIIDEGYYKDNIIELDFEVEKYKDGIISDTVEFNQIG